MTTHLLKPHTSHKKKTGDAPSIDWGACTGVGCKILVLAAPLLILTYLLQFHHIENRHRHAIIVTESDLGPYVVPNIDPEMLKVDFWISRVTDGKQVLMNEEEIKAWNLKQASEKGTVIPDLTAWKGPKTRADLETKLDEELAYVKEKKLYDRNRELITAADTELLEQSQNRHAIPDFIKPRFCLLVRDAPIRLFPTQEPLTEEPGDLEFDELQNSRAGAFTLARILHASRDQGWFYVQTSDVRGWVQAENVSFVPGVRAAKGLSNPQRFLVVTGDQTTLYANPKMNLPFMQVRMGTRLNLVSDPNTKTDFHTVIVPFKGSGGLVDYMLAYVKKSDQVSLGYLPFTRENILKQSFRLLGKPYGWGGLWRGRDCSSFLQDIFLTMGLVLPRNSKDQAEFGNVTSRFEEKGRKAGEREKKSVLDVTQPANSLLKLKGHILLYLGKVDNKYYAIHDSSGYRTPGFFGERVHKTNQVIVSDLSLGKGTKKRSLLERLTSVNAIA